MEPRDEHGLERLDARREGLRPRRRVLAQLLGPGCAIRLPGLRHLDFRFHASSVHRGADVEFFIILRAFLYPPPTHIVPSAFLEPCSPLPPTPPSTSSCAIRIDPLVISPHHRFGIICSVLHPDFIVSVTLCSYIIFSIHRLMFHCYDTAGVILDEEVAKRNVGQLPPVIVRPCSKLGLVANVAKVNESKANSYSRVGAMLFYE